MLGLIIYIIMVIGMWKIFEKAGEEGWKAIIPFYNLYISIVKIARKEWWYFILFFIPLVNIFVGIKVNMEIAKNFRISSPFIFALGLSFLPFIFYPILGFGNYDFCFEDEAEIID